MDTNQVKLDIESASGLFQGLDKLSDAIDDLSVIAEQESLTALQVMLAQCSDALMLFVSDRLQVNVTRGASS